MGWVPSLAAVGGAIALLVRRRLAPALGPDTRRRSLFMIYMGDQQRFFGRWLMPTFPIVALLGGLRRGVAGALADRRTRRVPAAAVIAVDRRSCCSPRASAPCCTQITCCRGQDTRNLTRAWMVKHIPAGSKIVVEPVVSLTTGRTTSGARSTPATPSGARWQDVGHEPDRRRHPRPRSTSTCPWVSTSTSAWISTSGRCGPELLSEYAKAGYCWVVIGSLQAGRSFAQPKIAPQAIAYYAQLANDAKLVYHVSPFATSRSG